MSSRIYKSQELDAYLHQEPVRHRTLRLLKYGGRENNVDLDFNALIAASKEQHLDACHLWNRLIADVPSFGLDGCRQLWGDGVLNASEVEHGRW